MTTIFTTFDLPFGWLRMYQVDDEAEAAKIAKGRKSFLLKSIITGSFYLFIPEAE